jgi:hypothetical protein
MLNKTEDELAELIYKKSADSKELSLKDDAIDVVLDLDSKRVDSIKKNVKPDPERLKSEYSRGVKEGLENLETKIRETYSVDSDKKGIELVETVIDKNKGKTKLTDDEVKKHPLYLALEKERVSKEEYQKLQTTFDEYKQQQVRNVKLSAIKKDAIKVLKSLNPVVSENPTVALTREEDYLHKFDPYDYELDDSGNHLVMKDGKRLEDAHGNPLSFNNFAKSIAMLNYDFKAQDGKGNAGNKDDKGGGGVKIPKTPEEYHKAMAEEPDAGKRVAIRKAYESTLKN